MTARKRHASELLAELELELGEQALALVGESLEVGGRGPLRLLGAALAGHAAGALTLPTLQVAAFLKHLAADEELRDTLAAAGPPWARIAAAAAPTGRDATLLKAPSEVST